jgi:hypothetical protein
VFVLLSMVCATVPARAALLVAFRQERAARLAPL